MIHCSQEKNKKSKQTVTIPRIDLEALEKEIENLKNKKDINITVHFRNTGGHYSNNYKPVTLYNVETDQTDGEVKKFIEIKLHSQIDEHYNQVLERKNEIIKNKNKIKVGGAFK